MKTELTLEQIPTEVPFEITIGMYYKDIADGGEGIIYQLVSVGTTDSPKYSLISQDGYCYRSTPVNNMTDVFNGDMKDFVPIKKIKISYTL